MCVFRYYYRSQADRKNKKVAGTIECNEIAEIWVTAKGTQLNLVLNKGRLYELHHSYLELCREWYNLLSIYMLRGCFQRVALNNPK